MKTLQCPRCGHVWTSTTIRFKFCQRLVNRKCKRCGRSAGRRAVIAED